MGSFLGSPSARELLWLGRNSSRGSFLDELILMCVCWLLRTNVDLVWVYYPTRSFRAVALEQVAALDAHMLDMIHQRQTA